MASNELKRDISNVSLDQVPDLEPGAYNAVGPYRREVIRQMYLQRMATLQYAEAIADLGASISELVSVLADSLAGDEDEDPPGINEAPGRILRPGSGDGSLYDELTAMEDELDEANNGNG